MSVDHLDPKISVKVAPTEYLYGVDPTWFIEMNYEKMLREKVILAKKMSKSLLEQQSQSSNSDTYLQYEYWLNDVYKAIEHNELLIKELNQFKRKK